MPLHIINEPTAPTNLGAGFSQILQGLAHQKMTDLQQQKQQMKTATGLQALGYTPEQSMQLSSLPQDILNPIIKQRATQGSNESFARALTGLQGGKGINYEGLNPHQAYQVAKLEALQSGKKEVAQEKKQQSINRINQPYLQTLEKGTALADELESKANNLLDLLKSGKVASGVTGKTISSLPSYVSKYLKNKETEEAEGLSNDIASLLASNSGVATNFKIKLAQERKANIAQTPEAQIARTQSLIEDAKKIKLQNSIKNEILEQNNGEQPPNLAGKVTQWYNQIKNLPDASEYEDNTIVEDNGKYFKVTNGIWMPLRK